MTFELNVDEICVILIVMHSIFFSGLYLGYWYAKSFARDLVKQASERIEPNTSHFILLADMLSDLDGLPYEIAAEKLIKHKDR